MEAGGWGLWFFKPLCGLHVFTGGLLNKKQKHFYKKQLPCASFSFVTDMLDSLFVLVPYKKRLLFLVPTIVPWYGGWYWWQGCFFHSKENNAVLDNIQAEEKLHLFAFFEYIEWKVAIIVRVVYINCLPLLLLLHVCLVCDCCYDLWCTSFILLYILIDFLDL